MWADGGAGGGTGAVGQQQAGREYYSLLQPLQQGDRACKDVPVQNPECFVS